MPGARMAPFCSRSGHGTAKRRRCAASSACRATRCRSLSAWRARSVSLRRKDGARRCRADERIAEERTARRANGIADDARRTCASAPAQGARKSRRNDGRWNLHARIFTGFQATPHRCWRDLRQRAVASIDLTEQIPAWPIQPTSLAANSNAVASVTHRLPSWQLMPH